MKTRLTLIAVAVLLLLLNLVKWFGQDAGGSDDMAVEDVRPSLTLTAGDFRLPTRPTEEQLVSSRDIFLVEPASDTDLSSRNALNSEENARIDRVRSMLNSVRLVGILSQDGKRKAFVKLADEPFMVFNGGRVGGRFVVKEIRQDSIRLYDPETSLYKEIVLSGD